MTINSVHERSAILKLDREGHRYKIQLTAVTPLGNSPAGTQQYLAPSLAAIPKPAVVSIHSGYGNDWQNMDIAWDSDENTQSEFPFTSFRVELFNQANLTTRTLDGIPSDARSATTMVDIPDSKWTVTVVGTSLLGTVRSTNYLSVISSHYTDQVANGDCPTIELIAARGSGENGADGVTGIMNGQTMRNFFIALQGELPSGDVEYTPVLDGYPAVPINPNEYDQSPSGRALAAAAAMNATAAANLGPHTDSARRYDDLVALEGDDLHRTNFWQSVLGGADTLNQRVALVHNTCPYTKIILAGYSQGAGVVGYGIDALSEDQRSQVALVVLFGDLEFNKGDSVSSRGTWNSDHSGIAIGKRPLWSIESPGTKVLSYCHNLDPVCQGRGPAIQFTEVSLGVFGSYSPHNNYGVPDVDGRTYVNEAAVEAYNYLAGG